MDDRDPAAGLDDALAQLRLQGAIFLHAQYTEGWAYRSAPNADLGRVLAPHARRIVPFHVVAAGRCWIEVDGDRHWADEGDVIVLPYGDPHVMGGTEDAEVVEALALVPPPPWTSMPFIEHGRGGALTHVVCGYLVPDSVLFDPELRALPKVLVVSPRGPAAHWVRASLDYALSQTALDAPDHGATPPHLVQQLLTEVLKLHLAEAPASTVGFLRALRDPVLAPALARIHRDPGHKWTVAELAALACSSETVLDEHFRAVLGVPPIRYLTAWRMHVAQDLLASSDLGVAAIARRVGYESEEAFSRAFKRKHEVAPSHWRRGAGPAPAI
jgi:AraC-like DNA-binding protein